LFYYRLKRSIFPLKFVAKTNVYTKPLIPTVVCYQATCVCYRNK